MDLATEDLQRLIDELKDEKAELEIHVHRYPVAPLPGTAPLAGELDVRRYVRVYRPSEALNRTPDESHSVSVEQARALRAAAAPGQRRRVIDVDGSIDRDD